MISSNLFFNYPSNTTVNFTRNISIPFYYGQAIDNPDAIVVLSEDNQDNLLTEVFDDLISLTKVDCKIILANDGQTGRVEIPLNENYLKDILTFSVKLHYVGSEIIESAPLTIKLNTSTSLFTISSDTSITLSAYERNFYINFQINDDSIPITVNNIDQLLDIKYNKPEVVYCSNTSGDRTEWDTDFIEVGQEFVTFDLRPNKEDMYYTSNIYLYFYDANKQRVGSSLPLNVPVVCLSNILKYESMRPEGTKYVKFKFWTSLPENITPYYILRNNEHPNVNEIINGHKIEYDENSKTGTIYFDSVIISNYFDEFDNNLYDAYTYFRYNFIDIVYNTIETSQLYVRQLIDPAIPSYTIYSIVYPAINPGVQRSITFSKKNADLFNLEAEYLDINIDYADVRPYQVWHYNESTPQIGFKYAVYIEASILKEPGNNIVSDPDFYNNTKEQTVELKWLIYNNKFNKAQQEQYLLPSTAKWVIHAGKKLYLRGDNVLTYTDIEEGIEGLKVYLDGTSIEDAGFIDFKTDANGGESERVYLEDSYITRYDSSVVVEDAPHIDLLQDFVFVPAANHLQYSITNDNYYPYMYIKKSKIDSREEQYDYIYNMSFYRNTEALLTQIFGFVAITPWEKVDDFILSYEDYIVSPVSNSVTIKEKTGETIYDGEIYDSTNIKEFFPSLYTNKIDFTHNIYNLDLNKSIVINNKTANIIYDYSYLKDIFNLTSIYQPIDYFDSRQYVFNSIFMINLMNELQLHLDDDRILPLQAPFYPQKYNISVNAQDVNKFKLSIGYPEFTYEELYNSQNKTYYKKCTNANYAVYYVNPAGGWNWMLFEGAKNNSNTQTTTYSETINKTTSIYKIETQDSYNLFTGYLGDETADKLKYLFSSKKIYVHDLESNELVECIIKNNKYPKKTFKNQGRKFVKYDITLTSTTTNTLY